MLAENIIRFYTSLRPPEKLPRGISLLNPYADPEALQLCKAFYAKYYSDERPRVLILGINPGRLGGGLTGIPFTDPVKLATDCGIPNALAKKTELSSDFIYHLLRSWGGPEKFYADFLFGSVCPLGFTRGGKNINYYDDVNLTQAVDDFCLEGIRHYLRMGVRRDVCFCLGEGKNQKFLTHLNSEYQFFGSIVPLPHPRFIMQYRRKNLEKYLQEYIQNLSSAFND